MFIGHRGKPLDSQFNTPVCRGQFYYYLGLEIKIPLKIFTWCFSTKIVYIFIVCACIGMNIMHIWWVDLITKYTKCRCCKFLVYFYPSLKISYMLTVMSDLPRQAEVLVQLCVMTLWLRYQMISCCLNRKTIILPSICETQIQPETDAWLFGDWQSESTFLSSAPRYP